MMMDDGCIAGQERYRAITNAYYRGALGAMLVYDCSKQSSFDNIPRWIRELKDHGKPNTIYLRHHSSNYIMMCMLLYS